MRDEDLGGDGPAVPTRRLNRIMESEMHRVGSRVRLGQAWQIGVIALDTVTDPPDYPLPAGGVQYAQIVDLRRQSDMTILQRLSEREINELRSGSILSGGYVNAYAVREAVAQTMTVMFDVRPTQVDAIDMLRSVIPATLADDDAASIPFDRDLLEGYRACCAAAACRERKAERAAALGVTAAYVQWLDQRAVEGIRQGQIRTESLKRSSRSRKTAWPVYW